MTTNPTNTDPGTSPMLSSLDYCASRDSHQLTQAQETSLLEPFSYLLRVPGKGVRPQLIAAFDEWLQIPRAKLEMIQLVVEQLHTASLLVDDIEDNSKMRRGVPVAHAIFGVPATINCANYVYFVAMRRAMELGGDEVVGIVVEELIALHEGQGLDIFWRDHNQCPSEAEYRAMVVNKTGGLFRLSVRLMQAFSACKADFLPLVTSLGIYFQVLDDYLNLKSARYTKNKGFCEDITEGKFSFPTVHHIRAAAEGDHRVINILKQRTEDEGLKMYALQCLEETGSFEYTRGVLRGLKQDLDDKIKQKGGNATLQAILEHLHAAVGDEIF